MKSPCPWSSSEPDISSDEDAARTDSFGPTGAAATVVTRGRAPLARTERPPAPEKQESRATTTSRALSA
ncbi:MAG: hypothetical protein HZB91_06045 [Elusimicrobia bacterium]|nr:hypothetical protein [Elusimicrobiota bacterium]